jgi:hypothetical protein
MIPFYPRNWTAESLEIFFGRTRGMGVQAKKDDSMATIAVLDGFEVPRFCFVKAAKEEMFTITPDTPGPSYRCQSGGGEEVH